MISIVIPTYMGASNLLVLVDRLNSVMTNLKDDYEIIFINDNSPDQTKEILETQCASNYKIKLITLSRNFGQQAAISAGLDFAAGDAVIIMDDDLQDPPEFIPELINIWKEGYDIVYAVRTKRKESLIKRIGYNLFYRLLNGLSENRIPKNAGDFSILDRKVVDILRKMPEIERFNRGLRSWIGFKQIGVTCEREARYMGQPAYNLRKTIKLALDGIVSFSNFPLRIASIVGFIVSTLSFFGFLFTLFQKFISIYYPNNPISVWEGFSTIVLSILFLGGVQLLMIGILGEYIGRIFKEVKNRPKYIVQEKININ